MGKSKTKRRLKGAKLEKSKISFIMHWVGDYTTPERYLKDLDIDEYNRRGWCKGVLVKNMYTKGGEVIITERRDSRFGREGDWKKGPEHILEIVKIGRQTR